MGAQLDLTAALEGELARLLEWVRTADLRLRFIVPLSTAMLGALGLLVPSYAHWTVFPAIMSTFACLFLVAAIGCSAVAAFPRTEGPKGSLIYFGGIAAMELEQYVCALNSLTAEQYVNDLMKQCHRNAQIARIKFSWVQRSMAFMFLASVPWTISLFVLYGSR